MLNERTATTAIDLFHLAADQAGDVKAGCLALIAAVMAGQHVLRGEMASAKVDDMMAVLSVAGAVLIDDECGGLLDLVKPAGSA